MTRIKIIFLLISILLFHSCCPEETYEVTITGLQTSAFILEDNRFVEFDIEQSINKEDLILSCFLTKNEVLISILKLNKKNLDTRVQKAAVVPCADPVFIYTNRIQSAKVEILDINNANTKIDITNQVKIFGSNQSLTEYISENKEWLRDFTIQFSDTTNIPEKIELIVEVTLDDGLIISSAEGIINFN